MEGNEDPVNERRRSQPTVPVQKDFLFVNAATAKTTTEGRRNARSFVMQKARKERPWSTSKHAKQRKTKSPESLSPNSSDTPDTLLTPNTGTPSPPIDASGLDYFPFPDSPGYGYSKGKLCSECQIFQCRPGQKLCPRCMLNKPAAVAREPNSRLFDPFRASSVEINGSVAELLEHCECWSLTILLLRRSTSVL
jgi:hypothetical protein